LTIGFLSHLDLNLYAFRLPVMLELRRLGHRPIAIAPTGVYLGKIREAGVETISYEISRKSLNPLREIKAIQNIYEAIKPLNLDILHTFTAKPNIYGTIAGRLASVPKIINLVEGLGSFYLEDDLKSRVVRSVIEGLYKRVFKLSGAVMFVNSDDPEYLINAGIISPEKVFKIDGVGIDTNEWRSSYIKADMDKLTRVIMVGRAIRHKGVAEFYDAAKTVSEQAPNVRFAYVGGVDEGNHSALDEAFMRSSHFVEYLGERGDVRELIDGADIFVLPSYREGLPRTILEAMSLGKPVVATDVSGCRDCVVDGETGFLTPAKDADALACAIMRLCADKALRDRFGQAGRALAVRRFDVKKIVQEHLKIYGIAE
jgi:N,N'-diacetylbacillosaminyl-diphospho-undecaprenol alpha-1,3-N-acetylgalactosaminyltransferase